MMALTDGLFGVWSPSLGQNGYRLIDRSGRGRHGTLNNMDAVDYVGMPGGVALDFANQTTDSVSYSSVGLSMVEGSVSLWALKQEAFAPATDYVLWSAFTSATDRIFLEAVINPTFGSSNPKFHISYANSPSPFTFSQDVVANRWYHIVATWKNQVPTQIYVNGVQGSTNGANYATQSTPSIERIGNYSTLSLSYGGLIDDAGRWTRAITGPEAAAIFNLGRGGLGRIVSGINRRKVYGRNTGNRRRRLLVGAGS